MGQAKRFTDISIRKIKPGADQRDIADPGCAGREPGAIPARQRKRLGRHGTRSKRPHSAPSPCNTSHLKAVPCGRLSAASVIWNG